MEPQSVATLGHVSKVSSCYILGEWDIDSSLRLIVKSFDWNEAQRFYVESLCSFWLPPPAPFHHLRLGELTPGLEVGILRLFSRPGKLLSCSRNHPCSPAKRAEGGEGIGQAFHGVGCSRFNGASISSNFGTRVKSVQLLHTGGVRHIYMIMIVLIDSRIYIYIYLFKHDIYIYICRCSYLSVCLSCPYTHTHYLQHLGPPSSHHLGHNIHYMHYTHRVGYIHHIHNIHIYSICIMYIYI